MQSVLGPCAAAYGLNKVRFRRKYAGGSGQQCPAGLDPRHIGGNDFHAKHTEDIENLARSSEGIGLSV